MRSGTRSVKTIVRGLEAGAVWIRGPGIGAEAGLAVGTGFSSRSRRKRSAGASPGAGVA